LATPAALNAGRQVLLGDCVVCHDLRTVLLRPRTPADWQQTVYRMLEKPNPSGEITLTEAANVTAYLIAITPDLQQSAQSKREQNTNTSASSADQKVLFEQSCAGCHSLDLATTYSYSSKEDANDIVQRMVQNGMRLSDADLKSIVAYINANFVK
jgi:mono/diheme cytochrome c family protein